MNALNEQTAIVRDLLKAATTEEDRERHAHRLEELAERRARLRAGWEGR